jgi:uncharacterized protein
MTTTAFDVTQSPPVPGRSALTAFYWEAVEAHRLDLLRCQDCGHFIHYPKPVCRYCLSTNLAPQTVSGEGSLYSYSEIMQAPHPYFVDKLPYLIGIIDIQEEPGIRVPTGLLDCTRDQLRCGMPMQITFRDLTSTLTLPFFHPARASA